MFANVGPAEYNYDETLSTLRYANRAKNIKNHARVNEDPKDALMRQYQKEIEELRRKLEEGYSDEESGAEDDDDNDVVGPDGAGRRRKSVHHHASEHDIEQMKEQIEGERKRLKEEKNMAEEERNSVEAALRQHEAELEAAQKDHDAVKNKLAALEKKIIVGGENLLEKAEEQERLLEESARELEETIRREEAIKRRLEEKEAERLDIEEKYSSLQEEAAGKARKLKKVWTMYQSAKAELADVQAEQQREMEGLLDNVRQLTRDLKLQMLVIDSFVPSDFQEAIERNVHWNEDIGEWQLRCVAYTGNNMRKRSPSRDRSRDAAADEADLSYVYSSYSDAGVGVGGDSIRPRTARNKRPKSHRSRV